MVRILCRHWDYVALKQEGSLSILQTETPARQRMRQ